MRFLYPLLIAVIIYSACANKKARDIIRIAGDAQGTTYHISYVSVDTTNYQHAIDSIFRKIDSSLSTYLPVSLISRVNKNDSTVILDSHFIRVYKKAVAVSEKTPLFDITVAPVINAWGFGFSKKEKVDSALIDSLLQFVGFKMVRIENNKIVKEKPEVMLDFNAIAQGYTVDVLSSYFESKGINNYFIELGGEVFAKGNKTDSDFWKVGIDKPIAGASEQREIQTIVKLHNKAMATSGNYRKFYEENGQKYSHIIDPGTGYPARNNLLSVSVIADDCMTADAYATVFMVMGLEAAQQFLSDNKDLMLEVYFIYDEKGEWKTFASENLKKWMEEIL